MRYNFIQFFIVSLMCFLLFNSCKPILKVALGVKNPSFKTDEEILKYSAKKLQVDSPIFRMKNYDGNIAIPLDVTTMPSIQYVVNDEVKELYTTCSADYFDFISSPLSTLNALPTLRQVSSEELNQALYNCSDENVKVSTKEPTFIVYYASYVGYLNKRDVLPWIKQIEGREDVNLILLNCDLSAK